MPNVWTLLYHGQEKLLKDWGISDDFTITEQNKGKCTATFRTTERFDDAAGPQFEFDEPGELRLDGAAFFRGNFDSPKHSGSGGDESVSYQLHDVWWKFERQQFKQHRNEFAGFVGGDPDADPILNDKVLPEVFLGEIVQNPTSTFWQHNGDTLREIVAWINETYNPTRRGTGGNDAAQDVVNPGTIEPQVFVPIQRSGYMYASEACFSVCRFQPDTVFHVDSAADPLPTLNVRTMGRWNYGTNPPTFLDYENLPEVTINVTLKQQRQIERQQQDMRRLAGVLIHYSKTSTIDGQTVKAYSVDKFPLDIDDFTPETSAHFVELEGANKVILRATVDARAVADAVTGSASDRKAWWLKHDKTLGSNQVDQNSISVEAATVVDEDGAPVDIGAFPYELYGTLPNWTGQATVRATVKARCSFDHYKVDVSGGVGTNKPDHAAENGEVTYDITLTDAASGPYSATATDDPGETAPVGVAQAVFRSIDSLQQEGTVTDTTFPMRTDIRIGVRLKIVGPSHTWTNVFPQSVDMSPLHGVTVSFGPSSPIDAANLLELARATRWRTVYNMPTGRATGSVSGSTDIDATAAGHEGNTSHGKGGFHKDEAASKGTSPV